MTKGRHPRTNQTAKQHATYERRWRRKKAREGVCVVCGQPRVKDKLYCPLCIAKRAAYQRDYYRKLKDEVLQHYGHECRCCGETSYEFLTLDHINEDGAAQRKKDKTRGGVTYFRKIRSTWPTDLQVLCWNCNLAKHHHGSCPHQDVV